MAGCGLVRACVGQEDGTSNLILQGLARVRFTGWQQEVPYRIAEIEPVESEESRSVEAEALGTKVIEICQRFKEQGAQIPDQLDEFLSTYRTRACWRTSSPTSSSGIHSNDRSCWSRRMFPTVCGC